MSDKPAINTNVRLFDLVRYMRSDLLMQDLITDDEYVWLCSEAPMANSPDGGSPSPRRLEDYDKLREENATLREQAEFGADMLMKAAEYKQRAEKAEAENTALQEALGCLLDWGMQPPDYFGEQTKQRFISDLRKASNLLERKKWQP